ncbi:MAG TPA: DUF302 domain-containing protein [Mycobacteriales bacterium]
MGYGRSTIVRAAFAETVQRVRDELAAEGFGVLTEIDITSTLRAKLGEQIEDYVVLGACNPPLAYQALTVDRSIGLLLPCNVAIRATEAGTVVEALDPQIMVELSGKAELAAVAEDAAARLARVLARVAE